MIVSEKTSLKVPISTIETLFIIQSFWCTNFIAEKGLKGHLCHICGRDIIFFLWTQCVFSDFSISWSFQINFTKNVKIWIFVFLIQCISRKCLALVGIIGVPLKHDAMEPTYLVLSITPRNLFENTKEKSQTTNRGTTDSTMAKINRTEEQKTIY